MTNVTREKYYEVYFDGQLKHEGTLAECQEIANQSLDDDCAEVYEVTVAERKIQ